MKVIIGQGSCGVATGAKKTAAEFEKLIEEKNLDVKVDITGCVGTCYLEPIVDIYDDNDNMTRYVKVKADKVEEIVEQHLVNGQVASDLAISDEDKLFLEKQKRVVLRRSIGSGCLYEICFSGRIGIQKICNRKDRKSVV